jgi:hypothetical protein
MGAGQESNIGNAIVVAQGTKQFSGYENTVTGTSGKTTLDVDAVTGSNNTKYTITLGGTIDPTQSVTVKTLAQDFILAKDDNGNYLVANTTGLTSEGLGVVGAAWTDNDSNAVFSNTDTFVVTFNRLIDTKTVVDAWDGTGAKAVNCTYNNTDGTITIPGVGVISGLVVDGYDSTVTANLTYSDTNKTITVTFTDATAPGATVKGSNYTFTPATTIKSASGVAIQVVSVGEAGTPASAPYLKTAVFTDADRDGIVEDGDTITLTFSEALENSAGEVVGAGDTAAILAAFDFSNDNFATALNAAAFGTFTITSPDATTDSDTIVLTVTTKGTADLTTSTKVKSKAATNKSAATATEIAIKNAVSLSK